VAAFGHGPSHEVPKSERKSAAPPPRRIADLGEVVAGPAPPPKPAPQAEVMRAFEKAHVRSAVLDLRSAVASGNEILERALYKTLAKNREEALAFAQELLAKAETPYDRDAAQKTVDALRR
jgi:hypothetical protein